jgi:hypothetical protein
VPVSRDRGQPQPGTAAFADGDVGHWDATESPAQAIEERAQGNLGPVQVHVVPVRSRAEELPRKSTQVRSPLLGSVIEGP